MEYDWGDIREQACDHFQETPHPEVEERILLIFHQSPALVVSAIENVGRRYDRGLVNVPWAMVAKVVETEFDRSSAAQALKVSDESEKAQAALRAKRYLQKVGYVHKTEQELVDELFGNGGILRFWPDDLGLVATMVELWKEVRPIGIKLEEEQKERSARYREARALNTSTTS